MAQKILNLLLIACCLLPREGLGELVDSGRGSSLNSELAVKGGRVRPSSNATLDQNPSSASHVSLTTTDGTPTQMTILSMDEAKNAFAMAKHQVRQGLKDPQICVDRAHLIAVELSQQKIGSAKISVSRTVLGAMTGGHLYPTDTYNVRNFPVSWKHHIANLIYVRGENGKIDEMVIDYFLYPQGPVAKETWLARMRDDPRSAAMSDPKVIPPEFFSTEDMYGEKARPGFDCRYIIKARRQLSKSAQGKVQERESLPKECI